MSFFDNLKDKVGQAVDDIGDLVSKNQLAISLKKADEQDTTIFKILPLAVTLKGNSDGREYIIIGIVESEEKAFGWISSYVAEQGIRKWRPETFEDE